MGRCRAEKLRHRLTDGSSAQSFSGCGVHSCFWEAQILLSWVIWGPCQTSDGLCSSLSSYWAGWAPSFKNQWKIFNFPAPQSLSLCLGPGQASQAITMRPTPRGVPPLGQRRCCAHLKFLIVFAQGGLHIFYFALDPMNYVASPLWRFRLKLLLFHYYFDVSKKYT